MKEEFEEPMVDVVELSGADVITESACTGDDQLPELTAG